MPCYAVLCCAVLCYAWGFGRALLGRLGLILVAMFAEVTYSVPPALSLKSRLWHRPHFRKVTSLVSPALSLKPRLLSPELSWKSRLLRPPHFRKVMSFVSPALSLKPRLLCHPKFPLKFEFVVELVAPLWDSKGLAPLGLSGLEVSAPVSPSPLIFFPPPFRAQACNLLSS